MMRAFLMLSSSSRISPSKNACSFFASSYSEFSDKSPKESATLIFSATSRRRTERSSLSSSLSCCSPLRVKTVIGLFIIVVPPSFFIEAEVRQFIDKLLGFQTNYSFVSASSGVSGVAGAAGVRISTAFCSCESFSRETVSGEVLSHSPV